jgi:hypothetical protein
MLGAILGVSKTPKGQDKKRAKKSRGEKSVTEPEQQHGELESAKAPPPPSDKKLTRESAKHTLRHMTDSWVSGHVTTKELTAVHARAKHVLSGKRPMDFKGPSGERKMKGLR